MERDKTFLEVRLDLHADVTDWNPNEGFEELLAVGTYQLDETTQVRHGALYTYSLLEDENGEMALRERTRLSDLPGIFDLQWIPGRLNGSHAMIVMALADGSLRFVDALKGSHERDQPILSTKIREKSANDADAMALTVDTIRCGDTLRCTSSYSDGSLKLYQVAPDRVENISSWCAHTLEAWVSTWSRMDTSIVYSGGDDALFQAWDTRDASSQPSRMFLDRKTHQAGVCCITEIESYPHMVLTGSYDQHIRIWDWRNNARPICSSSCDTGGGVWRIKPHPKDSTLLLTACMYNGFFIYKIVENDIKLSKQEHLRACNVVECEHYPHQQTLAYGAAWSHAESSHTIATCSFYDNLLHVWSPNKVSLH